MKICYTQNEVPDSKLPKEIPAPTPSEPVAAHHQRIRINLGRKRYSLDVAVKAQELNEKPAEVITLPSPGLPKP